MKLRRIAVVVGKDLQLGPKSLIFVFAVVMPVVLSLLVSLVFGTLFAGKPRLGIVDAGHSASVTQLMSLDHLTVRRYESTQQLIEDVERGALDVGLVLPPDLDTTLEQGAVVELDVYLWGESLLKHRSILAVTLGRELIALTGAEPPVETVITLVGDQEHIPWDARLFPLLVIMAIILGGTMVPATSIVEEKQQRTLAAVTVTPLSLGELLLGKAFVGIVVSLGMGLIILTMNRAYGPQPGLMVLVMALSATLAAALGVMLGLWMHDISTLFTALKSLGILLYAPAVVYLFPQLPEWVARIFPTYYMIGPIVDMSLHGAGWRDIASDVALLSALAVVAIAAAAYAVNRTQATRPS